MMMSSTSTSTKEDAQEQNVETTTTIMTCDALMAKSLVSANEQKAIAESERDETILQLSKMTQTATELEAELQAMTRDVTTRLNAANERIFQIQTQSNKDLTALQKKQDDMARQHDMEVSTLRNEADEAVAHVKNMALLELSSLKEAHETLVHQKEMDLVSIQTKHEQVVLAIRAEALSNVTTIQQDSETMIQSLIQTHFEEMATLQQKMMNQETACHMLVEEINSDAVTRLDAAEQEARIQISDIENQAQERIQTCQQELAQLQQELHDKEEEYKQSIANMKQDASKQQKEVEKHIRMEMDRITSHAKLEIQHAKETMQETLTNLQRVKQERNDLADNYKKATKVRSGKSRHVCVCTVYGLCVAHTQNPFSFYIVVIVSSLSFGRKLLIGKSSIVLSPIATLPIFNKVLSQRQSLHKRL
jgi:F0F1-type ATP synthase membrane subunit b/b'